MSGIRQSFIFAAEDSFGDGNADGKYRWFAPPPGSFINTTPSRAVSVIRNAGSKHWSTVSYGQLTGSFQWSFVLDYNYLSIFYFIFESVETLEDGTLLFSKIDTARVKPFTIRRVVLNKMTYEANDPNYDDIYDEISVIKGCIIRQLRMSRTSSESQFKVEITGSYADESIEFGDLGRTDWQPYNGDLTEYSCLYIGDSEESLDFVAVADSLSIEIGNNAEMIYNICSPFAKTFAEGYSDYSMTVSCYSNDPWRYKLRMFNGGKLKDEWYTVQDGKVHPVPQSSAITHSTKNLAPMPLSRIYVYNAEAVDNQEPMYAYEDSSAGIRIDLEDIVINSLAWPKGDGSKLVDNINSAQCRKISMRVKLPSGVVADPFDTTVTEDVAPIVTSPVRL